MRSTECFYQITLCVYQWPKRNVKLPFYPFVIISSRPLLCVNEKNYLVTCQYTLLVLFDETHSKNTGPSLFIHSPRVKHDVISIFVISLSHKFRICESHILSKHCTMPTSGIRPIIRGSCPLLNQTLYRART